METNDINSAVNSAEKKLSYLISNLKNTAFDRQYPRPSLTVSVLDQVNDVLGKLRKKQPLISDRIFFIDNKSLMQLVELHDDLGQIIELLRNRNNPKKLQHKNENKITLQLKNDSHEQKIRVERNRQRRKQNEAPKKLRRFNNALNNFVVMSAHSVLSPLAEEPSLDTMRKVKSTGTLNNQTVANLEGVKNVIIQCLHDLDKVNDYLNKNQSEESDNKHRPCQCSRSGNEIAIGEAESTNKKIVICINGREHECHGGNLQIIIKQCPEFEKKAKSIPSKNTDESPESNILHGRDLKSEDEKSSSNINIIFNTKEPSSSIIVEAPKSKQQVPLKMYETYDIPIVTENGEELVICLTVRPKHGESEDTVVVAVQQTDDDYCIPLSRTKICSSMQFDVVVAESKMKEIGIKHDNPQVDVKLQGIGVENILRASRPAKCGRQAVLNENTKDYLPYAVSLKSLPLEEFDTDIINQSLEMSLKKSKHSTIQIPNSAYFMNLDGGNSPRFEEKQVFFVLVEYQKPGILRKGKNFKHHLIKSKLNFYINLDDGKPNNVHFNVYDVHFFDLQKFRSTNKSRKVAAQHPRDNILRYCNMDPIDQGMDEEQESNFIFKDKIEKKKLSCHLVDLEVPRVERQFPPSSRENNVKSKCHNKNKPRSKIPVYRHKIITDFRTSLHSLTFSSEGCDNMAGKKTQPNRVRSEQNASKYSHSDRDQFTSLVVRRRLKIETHNIIDIRDRESQPCCSTKSKSDRFLNSCESNVKRIRKRRDFFTSRSQSEIITINESKRKLDPLDRSLKQLNDEAVTSRPRKASPSRLLVDYLASFLYDKFIKNLSRNAKEEIMQNIEALSLP